MTAICRLNVDDILSEWTAHKCDQPIRWQNPTPHPEPRFLTNWCDPRVTRHIRRHFSWLTGCLVAWLAGWLDEQQQAEPQLIERQQRNCKRVESLSQKTKTYAAFIRQPTMKPAPFPNPTQTQSEPNSCSPPPAPAKHIVNAHSTLCHFVLMACLPHSFYIKPQSFGGGAAFGIMFWFFFAFQFFLCCFCRCCCCSCCGKQITKQKSAQCS